MTKMIVTIYEDKNGNRITEEEYNKKLKKINKSSKRKKDIKDFKNYLKKVKK